jgi:hypothetical protein
LIILDSLVNVFDYYRYVMQLPAFLHVSPFCSINLRILTVTSWNIQKGKSGCGIRGCHTAPRPESGTDRRLTFIEHQRLLEGDIGTVLVELG